MKRLTYAMLFAVTASVVSSAIVFAQAKPAAQPVAKPAAQPPAPTSGKLVPPFRGEAELGVTLPQSKRVGNDVVTTIKVKNLATGSLAGLKVQEYWYDKGGNPVTGNDERVKTPLQPGATYTFVLKTPYDSKMNSNNYQFSHANGKIKTKRMAKIE